ncbi:hypothetical protein ACYSNM_10255 [Myroides sp. LJL116]
MNYWNKNSTAFFSLKGKLTLLLLFCVTFLTSISAFADGSKDLSPAGAKGGRAFLRVSERLDPKTQDSWPFPNLGTHYVYAKAGETITLASSSLSLPHTTASIIVHYLDNENIEQSQKFNNPRKAELSSNSKGYINNRAQELAGPNRLNENSAGKYTPHYFPVEKDGLYKVTFIASAGVERPGSDYLPTTFTPADQDWEEDFKGRDTSMIAAWDISVIDENNTGFIPGRVYSNSINLAVNGADQVKQAFYGEFNILTNDRHIYKVNNNGNNGWYFTFFSNNNGFTTLEKNITKASYLSLDSSTLALIEKNVHNPNLPDTKHNITHKIFYTLPEKLENWDLPQESTGAVPGGKTWLKQPVADTELTNVSIIGYEGTPNQMGNKGATISFEANITGSYTITISDPENPKFEPIILSDYAVNGKNTYFWDGKGNNGEIVPPTDTPLQIGIQLLGGEVHFPFFDVELNINGTIISRLDDDFKVASDTVYWDDSKISVVGINNNDDEAGAPNNDGTSAEPKVNSHLKGSKGLRSSENGHKYGLNNNKVKDGYGNARSLDTWTFIKAPMVRIEGGLKVKKSDLQIKPVAVPENLTVDQPFDIEVSIFNDGPTSAEGAVFSFEVPEGFTPGDVKVNVSEEGCAKETTAIALNEDKDKFTSTIDINSDCTLTYTITLVPTKTTTSNLAISILRPADNWDIDATSLESKKPIDPLVECGSDGEYEGCNNNTSIELKVEGIPYLPVISNRNIYHKVN